MTTAGLRTKFLSITRIGRPPGVPFDPRSPIGRMHGRVVTSTSKGKSRFCDVDLSILKGKSPMERMRTLDTIVNICLDDYHERLGQYGGSHTSSPTSYQIRSDSLAFQRTQRVYKVFLKTVKDAYRYMTPDQRHHVASTGRRLAAALRSWAVILGSSDDATTSIPFHL